MIIGISTPPNVANLIKLELITIEIISDLAKESRLGYCQDLVIKKLPDQNYVVLKFLVEFISLVRLTPFLSLIIFNFLTR